MSFAEYKRDDRSQRGAWAPGRYCCSCCDCGAKFIGDKRALECADCAYGPQKPAQYTHHVCAWILEMFSRRWRSNN
jgi:hypothetical protein